MNRFDDVRGRIASIDALARLSSADVDGLRARYPGLPEDYLDFLVEVGSGDLGEFQIYSGPVPAPEVYPSDSGALGGVLLVGDDFQGYCFGFDRASDFRLVEVSPRGEVDVTVEPAFATFVRAIFGEGTEA